MKIDDYKRKGNSVRRKSNECMRAFVTIIVGAVFGFLIGVSFPAFSPTEVVMAIKCRGELLDRLYTWINTKEIVMASKMVEDYSGMHLQPHKAIVGANAFAHQCGIHQDGVLKNKKHI